jgi:hypothetical protein
LRKIAVVSTLDNQSLGLIFKDQTGKMKYLVKKIVKVFDRDSSGGEECPYCV